MFSGPRWPSGKDSALGARRLQARNPIPPNMRRALGPLYAKSHVGTKHPPVGATRMLGERLRTQVPSSSSDRGSKLLGTFQNGPRVASKRSVTI
ncbi:hypothetical protein AVEN_131918-1 [Araneus ventricosus]|uniref:Uncharacterized protein n=1 Tax=Araneus ventricosus TaxID=182803 RepID=A0A4Y2MIX9_ARAVE|nr:hypothetical protein AVEN_131918-1 [Araneus ventricosus]